MTRESEATGEKAQTASRSLVVIASHPSDSTSMRRVKDLIPRLLDEAGASVTILHPPTAAWNHLRRWVSPVTASHLDKYILGSVQIAFSIISKRPDAVAVLDHTDAVLAVVPRIMRTKSLVVCHDLFGILSARGHVPGVTFGPRGRLVQWSAAVGLRSADLIVSISRSTSAALLEHLGLRSTTVPLPVDDRIVSARSKVTRPELASSPYALVVAPSTWRKNREAAISLWARMKATAGWTGLQLKVVGNPLTTAELAQLSTADADEVDVLQGITDADLAGLYEHADFLLFTSLHEGLGWPILEAQANATPVLALQTAQNSDTAGEAVYWVTPDMTDEALSALARTIRDGGDEYARKCLGNLRRFSNEAVTASWLRALALFDGPA